MTATTTTPMRELDHRHSDGIDVRLLWNQGDNKVHVAVRIARRARPSSSRSARARAPRRSSSTRSPTRTAASPRRRTASPPSAVSDCAPPPTG